MTPPKRLLTAIAFIGGFMWSSVWAQYGDLSKVKIETTEVAANIYMLTGVGGNGGNMGLLVSDDQVLLIDTQFAELSDQILKAIKAVTDRPLTYILNTHLHNDHIGGNVPISANGVVIIAHENVHSRLSSVQYSRLEQREIPPAELGTLPSLTFSKSIHFFIGDLDVIAVHSPNSHTDGDTIVQFRGANVMHLGDLFFNGIFPFIDIDAGGSLSGLIAASELALARTNRDTKIIPGHGPLATRADFRKYIRMLKRVHRLIKKAVGEGLSKEEVITANPLQSLEEEWGDGFIKTPVFTELAFELVNAEPKVIPKKRGRRR